jgi:hypothetical protein
MARKKSARKKKAAAGKKPASKKKTTARKKVTPKKKNTAKKTSAKNAKKKAARGSKGHGGPVVSRSSRGLGAASGGQSGDTQGLSRKQYDDSESVEELVEEGQYPEAEAVSGVENARDADQGEVRTTQFPEDDVPEEYLDPD